MRSLSRADGQGATHTEVRASGWKGDFERWPLIADINDPRLGLTFDQLTATLEPLGLPRGWDAAAAADLAQAVWVVLSRKAGVTQGGRSTLPTWQTTVTDAVITDVTGAALPFEDYAMAVYALREREQPAVGYGSRRAIWRRLVEGGGYRHVHGRRGSLPWRVSDVTDFGSLDAAWEQAALNADGDRGLLPVLDVRALSAMFPARRLVRIPVPDAIDAVEASVLLVPSFWEIAAAALIGGPVVFERRGRQCIADAANRPLRAKGDRPAGRGAVSGTLATKATAINGLGKVASEARDWAVVLAAWERRPNVEVTRAQRAAAPVSEPRVAPELDLYRFHRACALRC